jgi:hypothetical protein
MGKHHCGYSLTSWVPVTVGTATCGHSPLSRVLLIVVGTPHYRGYSSLSWVLLTVVGTPHYQEYSPLWILPSIMGVPRNHRYSYLWVLINIVGTPSAGFLQLTSIPASRETPRAEKNGGTSTLHHSNYAHTLVSIIFSHYAYAISDPKCAGTFTPKNYHRVVVAALDL